MHLKTLSTLGILAASSTFMTGCPGVDKIVEDAMADCNAAYDRAQTTINDLFDDAMKCCNKKLPDDPAGYAACAEAVNDSRKAALEQTGSAHAACVSQDIEVLKATTQSIIDLTNAATKAACDVSKIFNISQSTNGEYNNTTPADNYEVVRVELSGRSIALQQIPGEGPQDDSSNTHYNATLNGSVSFASGDEFIALPAKARLSLSFPQNQHESGIVHSVWLKVPGAGVFESPESFQGTLSNTDGRGFLINTVLVSANQPSDTDGLKTGLAVELPLSISGNRIFISTGNEMVSIEEVAPVAPNAIADWHRDFVVDMVDYSFFMESFASGYCDLNGDGETNDLDIEVFEDRFWAEFEG